MTIVAVAARMDNLILSVPRPGRHVDIMRGAADVGLWPGIFAASAMGFLTDGGDFLDRKAALQHVLEVGQPLACRTPHSLGLYSEDLW